MESVTLRVCEQEAFHGTSSTVTLFYFLGVECCVSPIVELPNSAFSDAHLHMCVMLIALQRSDLVWTNSFLPLPPPNTASQSGASWRWVFQPCIMEQARAVLQLGGGHLPPWPNVQIFCYLSFAPPWVFPPCIRVRCPSIVCVHCMALIQPPHSLMMPTYCIRYCSRGRFCVWTNSFCPQHP